MKTIFLVFRFSLIGRCHRTSTLLHYKNKVLSLAAVFLICIIFIGLGLNHRNTKKYKVSFRDFFLNLYSLNVMFYLF